jgi:pyrophosphatase PpaX
MADAALFDWDGTLLDSREALLRAWHSATERVLGRRFPAGAEEEELVFTLPGVLLFARIARDADQTAELKARFQEAYEVSSEALRAFPGIPALLAELRDAGVAIGVVTSKARRRYEADARRIGVDGLVDVAVCVEDTSLHKPDPAPVLHALRALGVSPDRAVMAGDTPVDLAAGTAAGTAVVGVAWGNSGEGPLRDAGATAIAGDASELATLVLQARAGGERITR